MAIPKNVKNPSKFVTNPKYVNRPIDIRNIRINNQYGNLSRFNVW